MNAPLPVGKLPADLLAGLLARAPANDPRVVLGPGPGLDCAVVASGPDLLVFKAEPITFATAEIGWYGVQVAANDIAATGAVPRWYLATLLLPSGQASAALASEIYDQIYAACAEIGVTVIGGHTEITYDLPRPILSGTMIGEVAREKLITPRGLQSGDRILLTKGVPIEATAILAREFSLPLSLAFDADFLAQARGFLHAPGISVLRDAQIATAAGAVHAMHDPTEGGLLGALWELAEAGGHSLQVDLSAVPQPPVSAAICRHFGLDPLASIASGALLIAAPPGAGDSVSGLGDSGRRSSDAGLEEKTPSGDGDSGRRSSDASPGAAAPAASDPANIAPQPGAAAIIAALQAAGIACVDIGYALDAGPNPQVLAGDQLVPRPARDEIARLYAEAN